MRVSLMVTCVLMLFGCSKNYTSNERNGVIYVQNTINAKNVTKLSVVTSRTLADSEYLYMGAVNALTGDVLLGTAHAKTRKESLRMYDAGLNEQVVMIKKEGKGPGEFSSWIPYFGFVDNSVVVLDGMKRTLEVFDTQLKHQDSVLLQGEFQLYRGPSHVAYAPDGYVFAPTVPYYAVRTDKEGKIINGIPTDLKTETQEERVKLYGYNANVMRQDTTRLYLAFQEGEDRYELRVYDFSLVPLMEIKNNDPLNSVLCAKQIKIADGSVQPVGALTVSDFCVTEKYIYVVRASGGYISYTQSYKKRTWGKVPGVEHPYIDVFDKTSGQYVKRIEMPFLDTRIQVQLFTRNTTFYVIASAAFGEDETLIEGSNTVYICNEMQ